MDTRCALSHAKHMNTRHRSAVDRLLVAVVDDDESIRESLPDLLRELGYASRSFSSAREFLISETMARTNCLLLDIAMPGMTGLDLQQELNSRGERIPIIFITAQKDDALRSRAFEHGAVGFLLKPFSDTDLLAALTKALGAC
jgi:FixJ family two-component response regulator